jgi:putative ABC transport system permease protein
MFRFLSLMVKNSLRNRRRSLLTIGSVAVSLCLLGVLFAIYSALFLADATPAQALRLVVRHRVSLTQSMPIAYRQKIQAIPGVRQVMVWQWFGGVYKDARDPNNQFARFAAEPDRIFAVRPEYQLPEDQKLAFQHERTGCIVSRDLADKLHFKLGDRITLVGDIFPVTLDLKVVGIFNEPEAEDTLYFSRDYLRDALGPNTARSDRVGAFQVQANTAEDVPRIAKAIDDTFDNAPEPTKSESERAFALSFASFVGNLKLFLLLICGAVTFTILLVSANTISMSVRERVREVGILKTLGFTQGNILGIILGEAGFIALIGGIVGCILAQMLCSGVRNSPGAVFMPALKGLTITPSVALICIGVALFIGLVSSLVPAWSAARTSILDSLRFSG